ncbi:MAG TPA: hypothetical protein VIF15_21240 [Polyangiaceae bacterium]|jgi:hypothetical protein
MLPLLLAATTSAAAAAVPTGPELTPVNKLPVAHEHRTGLVVGLSLGGGLGGASGYPNNASQIGDPSYYSASGVMLGTSETIFVMGALSDYLSFGFWYGHAVFSNSDWHSVGSGGGLRLELFPLVGLFPRLQGLGVLAQAGIGGGNLVSTRPGLPAAEGTESFGGAGAFYEWSFAHVFGGHLGAGPSLEYDAIWSQPFERHGLVGSVRLAFYGGP